MPNKISTDHAAVADRYLAVWSEPDPAVRRELVAGVWAPAGVEFVEGAQFRGHTQLEVRVAEAYAEFVGSGKYLVSSADDLTSHDNILTFTLHLISRTTGDPAWSARVFLILGEDALIYEDYQLTVKPLQ